MQPYMWAVHRVSMVERALADAGESTSHCMARARAASALTQQRVGRVSRRKRLGVCWHVGSDAVVVCRFSERCQALPDVREQRVP